MSGAAVRLALLPSTAEADGWRVRARITCGDEEHELWYRAQGVTLADDVNVFYPVAALVAMASGRPLSIAGAVSPTLHAGIERIQEIFSTWYPSLARVPVRADAWSEPPGTGTATGAFFSGGADSFYTALTRAEEISHLVFVTGFDVRLEDLALRAQVTPALREAARALGKTLVEVETNAREILDEYVNWLYHGYGPALASVALALRPLLRKVFLSSEVTYRDLEGRAGHPLTDRLWRTADTEIRHYGAHIEKARKYVTLAQSQAALDHLRVCWMNTGGAYNCGRCPKCLRTMALFASLNVLSQAKTFPRRLRPADLWRLAMMPHDNEQVRKTIESVRDVAVEHRARGFVGWAIRSAAHPARAWLTMAWTRIIQRARGAPRRAIFHARRITRRRDRTGYLTQ